MGEGELQKRAVFFPQFSFSYAQDNTSDLKMVSVENIERAKKEFNDFIKYIYTQPIDGEEVAPVLNELKEKWFNKWFGES
jgi:hypothetical protein